MRQLGVGSVWVLILFVGGCATETPRTRDGGPDVPAADIPPGVDAPADGATFDTGPVGEDAGGTDAPAAPGDDATVTGADGPRTIGCTARSVTTIVMTNTGTSTWTPEAGYALFPVGGSDPFFAADTRIRMTAGESVAPGGMRAFDIPVMSNGIEGSYVSDWQMGHDGFGAFGAVASRPIDVACDTTTVADFDLGAVTIMGSVSGSEDVRTFPVTSNLTSIEFRPGNFHIDHTRRGNWTPIVIAPDGTTQEATVWVFFVIDGRWYGTGGERLRPGQADKELSQPSAIGPGWLYDPGRWGIMTGYVPSPGDLVGFMVVAGSTRSDFSVVERERTGVVLIRFPADDTTTAFPPFEYQEPGP